MRHPLLVFLLAALVGFGAHRAIPYARACIAPVDTDATYDLTLSSVSGRGDTTSEQATWPETATLDLPDRRIDFADGTHLVFE